MSDDFKHHVFVRHDVRALNLKPLHFGLVHGNQHPRLRVIAIRPINALAEQGEKVLSAQNTPPNGYDEMRFVHQLGDVPGFADGG